MVPYTINTNERLIVYFICAIFSGIASSALSNLEHIEAYKLTAPSGLMIFFSIVFLYNNFLWKFASRWKISGIPDLNGTWKGNVERAEGQKYEVTAIISQTWEKVDFCLESDDTTGSTIFAGMLIENVNLKILKLIYSVKAKSFKKDEDNKNGEGVNEFRIRNEDGKSILEGSYYSSKHRGGKVTLVKQ